MSYLERLRAKAAIDVSGEPLKGSKPPFDPFGGDLTGYLEELPSELSAGLRRLTTMRAPRLIHPEVWPTTVADAVRLVREGWASKALSLDWLPLDLFGAVTDRDGDPGADGLAVWLDGRNLLAITAEYAVVDDGNGGRSYFNRCNRLGETLLWNIR